MKFTIKTPATTSNLGSGFDVVGMSFMLFNYFEFDFTQNTGIRFIDTDHQFTENLTLTTFFKILDDHQYPRPVHLLLTTTSNIPVSRGLGSSSTCVVAGIMAANIYANLSLSPQAMTALATQIEGHPDNVAPCFMGGCVSTIMGEPPYYHRIMPHKDLSYIALINHQPVETHAAREILPSLYAMADIVFNVSRASLLLEAIKSAHEPLLRLVTDDVLHQPYRLALIHDHEKITALLQHPAIITHWISGSGSTIMALAKKEHSAQVVSTLQEQLKKEAEVRLLEIDTEGAVVV